MAWNVPYFSLILMLVPVLAASQVPTTTSEQYSVRLANTTVANPGQGRVEVFHSGQWGTVCPYGWDFYSALVVCRHLGYKWTDYLGLDADMGTGTGPPWLIVYCKGSEASLAECLHYEWTDPGDCGQPATASCVNEGSDMKVRFHHYTGQLEKEGGVYVQPYPGSEEYQLCDQAWNLAAADVVCRQAGFHSAHRARRNSYYGKWPVGPGMKLNFLAANLLCTGNESNIVDCQVDTWFPDSCPTGQEAGVMCNFREQPEEFQIRLVGGESPREGLLEVFLKGSWGAVYMETNRWTQRIPDLGGVVCRELGFGYMVEWVRGKERFGSRRMNITIHNVYCNRDDHSVAQCKWMVYDPDKYILGDDTFGYVCSGPVGDRSPVRFEDFDLVFPEHVVVADILLIYHEGFWGTICDNGWTVENYLVACRELGFGGFWNKTRSRYRLRFAQGGPIWGNFSCRGDEETLDQCHHGPWNLFTDVCNHEDNDVYIGCSDPGGVEIPTSRPTSSSQAPGVTLTLTVPSGGRRGESHASFIGLLLASSIAFRTG